MPFRRSLSILHIWQGSGSLKIVILTSVLPLRSRSTKFTQVDVNLNQSNEECRYFYQCYKRDLCQPLSAWIFRRVKQKNSTITRIDKSVKPNYKTFKTKKNWLSEVGNWCICFMSPYFLCITNSSLQS